MYIKLDWLGTYKKEKLAPPLANNKTTEWPHLSSHQLPEGGEQQQPQPKNNNKGRQHSLEEGGGPERPGHAWHQVGDTAEYSYK